MPEPKKNRFNSRALVNIISDQKKMNRKLDQ